MNVRQYIQQYTLTNSKDNKMSCEITIKILKWVEKAL